MYEQENGQYVFRRRGEVLFATPEVAVMYERSSGVLVRHGPPARVTIIYDILRTSYREAGMGAMADDLVLVSGQFELAELNKMLTTYDYAGRYFAPPAETRAASREATAEDLAVFRQSRSASPAADRVRLAWTRPNDTQD